jgi:diguanylate cyclase
MKTIQTTNAISLFSVLEQEMARIHRTIQALKSKVERDDLTGLLRREDFFIKLQERMASGQEVSLIMLDIDNFKQINDTEGHQSGDQAIRDVAVIVERTTKAGATSGRYGGEEFIIAHCGNAESTAALAEALRRQIEREVCITVSAGVATAFQANYQVSRMVEMADKALYVAKRSGKNRVCLAA